MYGTSQHLIITAKGVEFVEDFFFNIGVDFLLTRAS